MSVIKKTLDNPKKKVFVRKEKAVDAAVPSTDVVVKPKLTLSEKKKLKKAAKKREDGFIALAKKRKAAKADKREKEKERLKQLHKHDDCVMKIKPIPHGFYENEIVNFFKQFGKIVNVKVIRAKNSLVGHTAYVRFESADVAKIAADSMNGYIMFETKLKCSNANKPLPVNTGYSLKDSKRAFQNIQDYKEKLINDKLKAIDSHNNLKKTNEQEIIELNERLISEKIQREEIKSSGIDYTFNGYQEILNKFVVGSNKPEPKQQPAKQQPTTEKPKTTSAPVKESTPVNTTTKSAPVKQSAPVNNTVTKPTPVKQSTPVKNTVTITKPTPVKNTNTKQTPIPVKNTATKSTPEKTATPTATKKLAAKKVVSKK